MTYKKKDSPFRSPANIQNKSLKRNHFQFRGFPGLFNFLEAFGDFSFSPKPSFLKSVKMWAGFLVLLSFLAIIQGCSQKKNPPSPPVSSGNGVPLASSQDSRSFEEMPSKDIRIVTAEPDPRICDYVDDVMGSSMNGNLAQGQWEARQELKDKADVLGGNTIRLDTTIVDDPGLTGGQVVLTGRVYKCNLIINPEALLGPINRELASQPRPPIPGSSESFNASEKPAQTPSRPPSPETASTSGAPSQSIPVRPPQEPGIRFDEGSFLQSGEKEFEG